MAATQYAYTGLKGAPVVARDLWHDRNNVMLVTDFARASSSHAYTQSFNLFTNNTTAFTGGRIHTATGTGDVMLIPLLLSGQTTSSKSVTLSNTPPPSGSAWMVTPSHPVSLMAADTKRRGGPHRGHPA